MNKLLIILTLSFVFSWGLEAQQSTKFWIKLTNKQGTPYSVSTPTAFLTPKSVLRRTKQNININESDLPVTPSYISQIDGVTSVKVLYASKWLNAVAVEITSTVTSVITTATNAINSFSFVQNTAPVNKYKIDFEKMDDAPSQLNYNKVASANYYGGSYWQNKQLRVDCIHHHGFRGQGMTIAVLDAGFFNVNTLPAFDSLNARNGVLGTRDFVSGGTSVYEDHNHGMNVLSCIAAVVPGAMVGSAPQAEFWLLRTEDAATETPSEEYNWIRGAEFADSVGVDILTTSLGYTTMDKTSQNHTYAQLNGKTAAMSIAATMASRKGIFVLNSAGNDGGNSWKYIGVPADADSICTVGAIDSLGMYAGFSSTGPTADGRIKPDLVAGGLNAYVASQFGGFQYANGTSFSCPILAGAIACFWQAHPTYSNMKVLDTLRHTASINNNPNNTYGYGIPNMCVIEVGIRDNRLAENTFMLFPNPFKSTFKIKLSDESILSDDVDIKLYSILGELLFTQKQTDTELEIDLSSYTEGIYFIELNTSKGTVTQKIIKE